METNGSTSERESEGRSWADIMDKEQRRSRSRSPMDKSSKKNSNNRSRDSSQNRNSSRSRNRSRSPRSNSGGKRTRAPTNRRVYVANIPYDCKWTTVKDLFREKVGDVSYVELFEDENGKFRGCGIVELKEANSVQKAVEVLHRFEFKGRQLVVKEDFDVDRDKTGKPLSRGGGGGSGGGGGGRNSRDQDRGGIYGGSGGGGGGGLLGNRQNSNVQQYNTFGLSPQFLDSLGIAGPLTNRIFVANLDYKVTTQKLEDVFKLAGRVVTIELKRDDEGNSKGHGTIEMGHPVEAVQAISMFNGQRFHNRTMSVRMDKRHKDDADDKRLPEGLQSVGKGLGANGLPLHLSNSGNVANLSASGISPLGGLGGVGTGNLGLMANSGLGTTGVATNAGGIAGLGGIGMGLGVGGVADRNVAGGLGGGVGLTGVNQNLGLGNSAATAGLGNPNLMGSGFGAMTSSNAGGLGSGIGSGLGTSLAGGIGSGLNLGNNSLGTGGGIGGYNDYDRNYDRRDDYNRNNQSSSDTIVVRNLPSSVTWQNLRDRFRDIGDIRFTEMKGRGMAVIRYTSERDAQRAVDLMRGVRIDGRPIDVGLY